jgi:class 3 adenylate cyclase
VDERPVTGYASSADGVRVAYQVFGDGPVDLVFLPGLSVPIDLLWDEPGFVRLARRMRGFSRTVWCETRGLGASGGEVFDSFVEETAEADLMAVLGAVGCEQVVLFGTNASGPPAIRLAATHPERVAALILFNTFAYYVREDNYPWGLPADVLERFAASQEELWESDTRIEFLTPSKAGDVEFHAWWTRSQRLGLRPDQISAWMLSSTTADARPLLGTLTVPTLVLHRAGDAFVRAGASRYMAEQIPGATYVELSGNDHTFFVGDIDALVDEVEQFVTGGRQAPEGDVVLVTVLFTDIVASTEQSARLGHRTWTAMTDAHDTMVRTILRRYRGREIKTTGDGFLATFDAATRAVRAAIEIANQAKSMGLDVRAGVHVGEVEVRPDDVIGLTVSIAKRICDLAGPTQVFTSRTVSDVAAGSAIRFADCGDHTLKGVPGTWRLFTATP